MHKRNRLFVIMGLFYALVGGLLGIVWLIEPTAIPGNIPRLHGHVMLLGFVAMLIYGIGLHVLPRFSGRPLYSEWLANWQFYAANLGLWLLAAGWLLLSRPLLVAGGGVTWLGFALFSFNILMTVRHYGPRG